MEKAKDRLTIYLDTQAKRELLSKLCLEGKSASEFFRSVIVQYLGGTRRKKAAKK